MEGSKANDRQVGGSHYGGGEYQHWDWAHDCRLHGLAWTASKYVDRWRGHPKGKESLEKALHYYDKAEELGVQGSSVNTRYAHFWELMVARRHHITDGAIIFYIMEGNWQAAREATQYLLEQAG